MKLGERRLRLALELLEELGVAGPRLIGIERPLDVGRNCLLVLVVTPQGNNPFTHRIELMDQIAGGKTLDPLGNRENWSNEFLILDQNVPCLLPELFLAASRAQTIRRIFQLQFPPGFQLKPLSRFVRIPQSKPQIKDPA